MSVVLDLSKKFELDLKKVGFDTIPTMRTRLAVDKSGSMSSLFRNGFVEKTIELFMGAASNFDDNAELDYTFFNSSASKMKSIGIDSYKSLSIPEATSGTNYVPALEQLVDMDAKKSTGIFGSMFGKKDIAVDPVYIGFITDGDASDFSESLKYMDKIKGTRNFVQFIVLGSGVTIQNMQRLSTNENVAFDVIQNPSNMTVDELYGIIANTKLLNWYKSL